MVLERPRTDLVARDIEPPRPGAREILVEVRACGVCRTDLHVRDGDLPDQKRPLVPGHEIVGVVRETGRDVTRFHEGDRVGIPWLGWTCGACAFCRRGQENLCPDARFTGYQHDGGYAERAVGDERFTFAVADGMDDAHAAPLLCAGLIGHRALRAAGDPALVGLYGFGAAAHIVAQVARHEDRRVFAFTRASDLESQRFARALGSEWAGDALGPSPEPLDAALIFAPAGELVPPRARGPATGRRGRVRGDPHERHPGVPVRAPLGRTDHPFGREPHATGRRRVPRPRDARADTNVRAHVSARACE